MRRTPGPLVALAAATVIASMALSGCGDGTAQTGKRSTTPPGLTAMPDLRPRADKPVRKGKGGKLPDDINGDGYPDARLMASVTSGGKEQQRLMIVYGSRRGLDPRTRTIHTLRDFGLPVQPKTPEDEASILDESQTADLDGDGFPDFLFHHEVTKWNYRTYVSWGDGDGPRGDRATPLPIPVRNLDKPLVGDFDGDGRHDLLDQPRDEESTIRIYYGPFTRSGKPRNVKAVPLPKGFDDSPGVIADRVDGKHATDVIVTQFGLGKKDFDATLHYRDSTGKFTRLPDSQDAVFGEFDGDDRRDIALVETGFTTDEEGDGGHWEGPVQAVIAKDGTNVDRRRFTLRQGLGRGGQSMYVGGDRPSVTVDTDGDKHSELANFRYNEATTYAFDGSHIRQHRLPVGCLRRALNPGKAASDSDGPQFLQASDFDADGEEELIFSWNRRERESGPSREDWWVLTRASCTKLLSEQS